MLGIQLQRYLPRSTQTNIDKSKHVSRRSPVLYKKSFHLPVNVPPAFDFAFYVQCLINNQINQCRHWNSLFATLPGDRHISVNESLEIPLGNHLHFQNTAIANSRLDDQMRRAKYEMQYMQNSEHFKINYKQVVFLKTRNLFL